MNTKQIITTFTILMLTVLCSSAFVSVPTITDGTGFQYENIIIGDDRIQIGSTNITKEATFVIAASDSLHKEGADFICSGADDQVVIQAAIDAAKNGDKLLFLDGGYWLSDSIKQIDKTVTIEGIGHSWTSGGTIFYMSPGANCDAFQVYVTAGNHTYFPTFRNFMISGKKDDQGAGTWCGIHIWGAGVDVVSDAKIMDVGIVNCKGHGIFLETGWLNTINRVWSEYNGMDGLRTMDGQPKITNSHFAWNGGNGLTLISKYSIVTASTISQNYETGIVIQGDETTVNGCRIMDNNQNAVGTFWGMSITAADHTSIVNNKFDGNGTENYGIRLLDSADYTLIANNQFWGHISGAIEKWTPQHADIRNNQGYVTENSGTATLASGTTVKTITHGLAVTPAAGDVMVTPMESLGSASFLWIDGYTATTFNVTANADPTQEVDIAWCAIVLG